LAHFLAVVYWYGPDVMAETEFDVDAVDDYFGEE
jgi:hypothetical protein